MFVDTNVLVKARFLEAPDHEIARASLQRAFDEPEPLRISRQILREYLAVVTRPQTWLVPISREIALGDVERLVGTYESIGGRPRGNGQAGIAVPRSSGGRSTDSRRQHSGHHAGLRGAQAVDVQL